MSPKPLLRYRARPRLRPAERCAACDDARALHAWFARANDARKPERFGRDEEGER